MEDKERMRRIQALKDKPFVREIEIVRERGMVTLRDISRAEDCYGGCTTISAVAGEVRNAAGCKITFIDRQDKQKQITVVLSGNEEGAKNAEI